MASAPAHGPCPLCATDSATEYHRDQRGHYVRCENCALVYLRPDMRPTPLQEVLRYQEHKNDAGDAGYVQFLRRLADPLRERLTPGARGLDYGCGPARVLADILSTHGFATQAYDPLFHPDVSLLDTTYDFITCSEVIEHVHDPRRLFVRFAALLGNGGTLALMTSFYGEPARFGTWSYRRDPTHVCFYCESTMRWIARAHDWGVEFPAMNVTLFKVPAQ